ncbi:SusD/RagB family nutrient-binding outer membrane lipoprotein [Muricauda sp. 2012CJ35-5]|uniref:SusD/RagB family nutrient-binding outer membrane lipoprotein n=1 Tax=Flagellimonas spongiicola TaxID=2942208 RepID=A0ABT0PMM2_9FLAO|nr:SusD/RagB family nutrient-binding outer membrane lipoprotein [Allomuricauda spongiicola]MCL6272630.1 SusD/RagB family nutrient-binding outer membrane lipoprotein [Allomuricauda spongiicola]
MKRITRNIFTAFFGMALVLVSCETTELDLTQNPNALTPDQASADFLLNSVQEDFVRQFEGDGDFDPNDNWASGGNTTGDGFNELGMELTRIVNMGGRNYVSVYQGSDMSDEWSNAYRILANIRTMQPLAEQSELFTHLGMANFFEAYLFVTMVDFFGDVPYSEAAIADDNFNPVADPGASIYDAALALLDQAIANFNATESALPPTDLYFNGDENAWVRACNTLKMKIYLQRRSVDASAVASFNAIVTGGNYIADTTDDMIFNWGATSASRPDNRHPRYGINYTVSGAGEYMSNWLMNLMDTTDDPRIRYYFYRQASAVPGAEIPPDEETLNCSLEAPPQHYIDGGFTFCYLPNGFWGRDHGDADGTPPDGLLRTVYGTYPIGGKFDDDSFEAIGLVAGAAGAGITNLLTAYTSDFMIAEMAMVSGDEPAAKTALLNALDKSVAKVQAFASTRLGTADGSFQPDAAAISAYRDTVDAAWDAADTNGRWNLLAEQYWVAHFGNGVEPYNFYRRTGFPTTLQPNLEPNPDVFIRSMYYPTNSVNNNSSISQKPNQQQTVFWDTGDIPAAN